MGVQWASNELPTCLQASPIPPDTFFVTFPAVFSVFSVITCLSSSGPSPSPHFFLFSPPWSPLSLCRRKVLPSSCRPLLLPADGLVDVCQRFLMSLLPQLASSNILASTHTMSKVFKFLVPAAAVAGGLYYFQSGATAPVAPVFKGDGEWVDLKLTNIKPVSHDTRIYTFSFPDANQTSGLVVASAILTKFVTAKGNNVIRPYTPISDVEQKGSFDLLVKTYEGGKMSVHIHNLKVDDTMPFKGPILKWKWEPNQFKEIALIGGGTGITPLYQVIHQVLKNSADKTKITLLYGSKSVEDILLKPELDALAAKYPDQFKVKYFVDKADDAKNAEGVSVGYINKEVLESNLPKPSPQAHVFVCGPPPLYKAISGVKVSPTDQGEVTGILKELGFDKNDVFKF